MKQRAESPGRNSRGRECSGLNYKFQRLREQIRNAILNGEFGSRLPGERELGRHYQANPKTVNKALGDLSSEGLVVRHIGRGTFVARQDGDPAAADRQLSIQCLVPPDSWGIGYRAALLSEVDQILTARGHVLENRLIESTIELGRLPLAAWASPTRHSTDGLLCYPSEPLSGAVGRPSDELVAETLRRHVAVVVMGACSGEAKLNAIAPDYTDAGFRLCEHLYRVGCRTVVILRSELAGREAALVVGGCQAAAVRWGRRVAEVTLAPAAGREGPLQDLESRLAGSESLDGPVSVGRGRVAGLVCIGARALEAAIRDEPLAGLRRAGRVEITSVSEPGDGAAEAAGITSYEVASGQIAGWAARLLAGTRPGQRPVEVIISGTVRVRGQSRSDDVPIRDDREPSDLEPPWSNREVLSGTII